MNPESSFPFSPPIQEPVQDLQVELVRHYVDVLRMLTDRISSVPAAPDPAAPDPVVSAPEESAAVPGAPAPTLCWESAVSVLACRDWHTESLVHLWLRPSYVMGLHVLFGIGVSLRGHRRIVTVTECGPQDQSGMEAVLDDLSVRGLGSGMLLTLPGNVALHAAVSRVWGGHVWVQRCLNTVMAEALSGLDPDEALRFRHRLRQAWQQCDASQARTDLQQITAALTQVNRSSGSVLAHALESTLTLQRTGRLLHSDRGLRVLNSLRTLLARAGRRLTATPVHQREMHLCAALLELEPRLRRVRHATYLPQLHAALKTSLPSKPSNA